MASMGRFHFLCVLITVVGIFAKTGQTNKFDVIFKNVSIACDLKYVQCTAAIRKERGHRPVIDLAISVVNVPPNVYIQSLIHTRVGEKQGSSVISGKRMEFCEFCRNPKIDLFLSAFFRLYKKAGSSLTSCPIEQKTYSTRGIAMDSKLLPSFTPLGNYTDTIAVTTLVKGKHQSVVKLDIIVSVVTKK